jgi:hypothetical protein
MAAEHEQDAIRSATRQSRERAGTEDGDAGNRPGDGPPVVSDESDEPERIDGAADAGPGTMPEGATPRVPRTSGDPLADAHGPAAARRTRPPAAGQTRSVSRREGA